MALALGMLTEGVAADRRMTRYLVNDRIACGRVSTATWGNLAQGGLDSSGNPTSRIIETPIARC